MSVIASNYTITYNLNGGTQEVGDDWNSYTFGTGLTLPTPTRTGWTFGGWYANEDFTGSEVTAISATDTGNREFWAKWIDTTDPTGEIKLRNNAFTAFLNTITFGLFFKGMVDVTITGEDGQSGVKTVEYLLSDTAYDTEDEVKAVTSGWETIANGGTFSITANFKGYIYARITDKAGNVKIVRSDDVVRYTDSQTEVEVSYVFGSDVDLDVDLTVVDNIAMNENTVKSITGNGIEDGDYIVDNNTNTITFKKEFMANLSPEAMPFRINYQRSQTYALTAKLAKKIMQIQQNKW